MGRKGRKQRVVLRFRRREQLKHTLRVAVVRTASIAVLVGFGAGLMTGRFSFISKFIQAHTPRVEIHAAPALAGVPALEMVPREHFWLWLPGSELWIRHRLCRRFPQIRTLEVARQFDANRAVITLEPRIPLVFWNGMGFDREGISFAYSPGVWKDVPTANFQSSTDRMILAHWLAALAAVPDVWTQIISFKQSPTETIEITLKTGTVVIWGEPVDVHFSRKAQMLARILDDAHANLGGAARADLRFFEQGRIIVMPKGR